MSMQAGHVCTAYGKGEKRRRAERYRSQRGSGMVGTEDAVSPSVEPRVLRSCRSQVSSGEVTLRPALSPSSDDEVARCRGETK